jgi:ArsR family transcriptional regulator
MEQQREAALAARAAILKAMAHPARLMIIEELASRERCVAELTAMAGLDVSTVSKHLSRLKAAGLVTSARRGAQVYYSLRVPCVLNFFGCVEAVMRATAEEHQRLTQS